MKFSPLLIAGSLAANVALCAFYFSRTSSGTPAGSANLAGGKESHGGGSGPAADGKTSARSGAASPSGGSAIGKGAWSTLNTGDLHALADRLRAAGFPPSIVRAVVGAQINESFKARRAALMPQTADRPFWSTESPFGVFNDPKYYSAMRDLNREQSKLLKEIVGEDPAAAEGISANQRRRFGDLPRDKIDQLSQIEQDYNDLRNEVNQSARGIMLPEDRQKLAMLEQEKRTDLAQVLSGKELEDYLMRTSRTTNQLRQTFGLFNPSETEVRAIYAAQSVFDEKYNPQLGPMNYTAETMKEREEAQKQVYDQIRSSVGDDRYAEYLRASDREFQQLNRIAQQGNVSGDAMVQAFSLRDTASKESTRIFNDTALSVDDKRAALQALAQSTRTQITTTLGPEVGASYLKVADRWLTGIERGGAVTFNETGNTRVRMLPQPRPQRVNPTK